MANWSETYSDLLASYVGQYKDARGNSDLRTEILSEMKSKILQHPPSASVVLPKNLRVAIRREFLPELDPEDQDDEENIIKYILEVTDKRKEGLTPSFETPPQDGKEAFSEASEPSKDWVLKGEQTLTDYLLTDPVEEELNEEKKDAEITLDDDGNPEIPPWTGQKLKVQQNLARAVFQTAYGVFFTDMSVSSS
ncbi:hypothetical protein EDC04DRAFT_2887981 [Pisolithus marmoratus]|nr:hypothetical protein EDC04DRAFT_2887981 [Pisolithus marmoratus]